MTIRWHDGLWEVRDSEGRVLYKTLSAQMAAERLAELERKKKAA
jgi:hypothetical protein